MFMCIVMKIPVVERQQEFLLIPASVTPIGLSLRRTLVLQPFYSTSFYAL